MSSEQHVTNSESKVPSVRSQQLPAAKAHESGQAAETPVATSEDNARILDEMRSVMKSKLELDDSAVTESTRLTELGADSLMLIEMMMEFEERFGIDIKEPDMAKFATVGDVVRFVQSKVKS